MRQLRNLLERAQLSADSGPLDAAALQACGGNRRLAASRLGISRAGLYAKLQQHGIAR